MHGLHNGQGKVRAPTTQLPCSELPRLHASPSTPAQGYALMCVSMPLTDVVLETVPEDEAYELQFGRVFAEQAVDPNAPNVERDDFAIELALLDE